MTDYDEIRMDHRCSCPGCDPRTEVHTARTGPQHISVRWWDAGPDGMPPRGNVLILLNGVQVEGVFEAILGEEGSVWRYRGMPSLSNGGRHLCGRCVIEQKRREVQEREDGSLDVPLLFPEVQLCTERLDGAVELRAKPISL